MLGDPERRITGVAALEEAGPGDLSFFTNPRYREAALVSRAGAILVGADTELPGRDLLEAEEPYLALAEILDRIYPEAAPSAGVSPDARLGNHVRLGRDVAIDPFAVIGHGCVLGDGVAIGAGCVVGERCTLGDGARLYPRVVLYPRTEIGARCRIHSGVVLGGDGFGYATSRGIHRKVPQLGRVVLEDDVEIGANTTIDRGTIGETRIGAGTKIDNLVMLGHGVVVGAHSILAGQVGIAGSTRIGQHVVLGGQVGAIGHLRIGDRVMAAARAAIYSDVDDGAVVGGMPAMDHKVWRKTQATLKVLPEMRTRLRALEEKIALLERATEEKD